MKVVLAEKPSVARELAAFLGATTRREGYLEGRGYQVTWALGHLATLKEPQDYDPALKRWSLESLPILPERFELKPLTEKGAGKQFSVVKRLFRDADELICATDAGREGELIFRYILELAGCLRKPARRLWLSSLTESAIREAFGRLRPLSDYDTLYAAARCRSEADWVVGLNATRCYTVRHRESGQLWSVGRVQTPVLAMIARRDDEIRSFKPEPFWDLLTRYRGATFKFAGDRFPTEEGAAEVLRKVQGHPFAIQGVDRKPERIPPPQLYDLTDLQRDMNRRYGFSADSTLKSAQSLYEGKLISYPRTDSRYLGADMKGKIPEILQDLRALKPAEIARLDLHALPFHGRIINDGKVTDHHAIIPTGKSPGTLPPASQKVYDAIVTRLIAAFYPACVKEVTTVTGLSNAVPFRARGIRVVDAGWTALYPRKADPNKEDEQDLPEFRPGETGPHEPSIRRGETSPPRPFTEGTLLGAMETAGKLVDDEKLKEALKERGLGTPATRASIIETLLGRGYILRENKSLSATDTGRYLVAIIQDRNLKSPELTGDWEAELREVEQGRLDPRAFMEKISRYTGEVIRANDSADIDPARLGDCPRCARPVIRGKKAYGCSGWREGCPFVLGDEHRGVPLSESQVRELLQRRVLLQPVTREGMGPALLQLLDSGEITEIPVPQGEPRSRPSKMGRSSSRASTSDRGPRRSRKGRELSTEVSSKKAEGFASVAVGSCPLCKSEVVEQEKVYACGGCRLKIWKSIAGKKVSIRTVQALLRDGKSPRLKGFRSKTGQPFEARLRLEGEDVKFDFGT